MIDEPQIPVASISGKKLSPDILRYVPMETAYLHKIVPFEVKDGVLHLGMVKPEDIDGHDIVQFMSTKWGLPYKIFSISEEDFQEGMTNYKEMSLKMSGDVANLVTEAVEDIKEMRGDQVNIGNKSNAMEPVMVEDAPVTKIVSTILQYAIDGTASDIHIEPEDNKVQVRFRVDGELHTSLTFPMTVLDAIVARIKILTNMKLDEKRKPQDGRFSAKIEGRQVDFRVSTMPTYFGEKIVIRILDAEKKSVTLDSLGMSQEQRDTVTRALSRPFGLILLTGPTGSGKTTSLYAMLSEVDREKNNVVSLEDPIEYAIPGISQSQVRPEIEYTFASGLRSILRQDPDIIMVGEIRDKETAKLAVQAALTGHLVFSTLHTNNSQGVIPRLIDMGIEPYLIPPTLALVIGQRLVPTLCEEAREELPVDDSLKMMVEEEFADLPTEYKKKIEIPEKVYRPGKSASCPSGVRGRVAVYEMLEMDEGLEKLVLQKPGESEIYKYLRTKGFITMREDAMMKAFRGLISFDEVNKL